MIIKIRRTSYKNSHSIHTTMTTVNTKGLVLGMLAIGGLIAGGAMFTGQQAAYAQITVSPVNAASASNSDDDFVVQSNDAKVSQKGEVKCEAEVEDNDVFQVGDNTNSAANGCSTTQSSSIGQTNVNTDNDVQVAEADACQGLGLIAGANVCDTTVEADVLGDLLGDLLGTGPAP
jgi:hypothetical protein